MGPTVYSPYLRRLASLTIIMQMKLQRQHFLLRYFETLGDVRPESNSGPRAWQPDAQPTEPQVFESGEMFFSPKETQRVI